MAHAGFTKLLIVDVIEFLQPSDHFLHIGLRMAFLDPLPDLFFRLPFAQQRPNGVFEGFHGGRFCRVSRVRRACRRAILTHLTNLTYRTYPAFKKVSAPPDAFAKRPGPWPRRRPERDAGFQSGSRSAG